MGKKLVLKYWLSFRDIFNLEDEEAKGRAITLSSNILTSVYNLFFTGIFYTGFLTMYGMSITDAGIVSFIPFIANLFSLFSNKVLGRFKRPKKVLVTAKIIFYTLLILATTIMPNFVADPRARLVWFVLISFVSHAFYSMFLPGITTWFYNFYPQDNERRTRYLILLQIFSSIISALILLFSSYLTDMLANSPYQNQLILAFRYFGFLLVLLEIFIQSRAKEYPVRDDADVKIKEVFTLPFRYPKFLRCMLFMFAWNFISNLNNGLWHYHLLNHMNFSYVLINAMTVCYTFMLIFFSPVWQRVLRRYSWIKTFGIAMLFWVPTEVGFFLMTAQRGYLFVPLTLIQHILSVGLNISYANILYMNLPVENSRTHIIFNTIGCNIFAFLGLITGTMVSSITGDETMRLLGMDVYSVQFTTLLRGFFMLITGLILVTKWRAFTSEIDIAEIERREYVRRKYKHQRRFF